MRCSTLATAMTDRALIPSEPVDLCQGDTVITPAGHVAEVLRVDQAHREATVRRVADSELASFRATKLKRVEP